MRFKFELFKEDLKIMRNQSCIQQGQAQKFGIWTLVYVYGCWTCSMDWG